MQDRDVLLYLRAAKQRLEAADVLAEQATARRKARLNLDAIYLSGYCIECCVKALILSRTPPRRRPALISKYFRGPRAHQFDNLMTLLHQTGTHSPRELRYQILKTQ